MESPKILIVVQSRNLRDSIKGQLLQEGFSLTIVHDKEDPIKAYREIRADLVIFESSNNQDFDGIAVAEKLRLESRTLPLILVTQESSEELAIAALRAGVNNYFRAPFPAREFLRSIKVHLGAHRGNVFKVSKDRIMIAESSEMLAVKRAIIGDPDTRVNGQMVDIGYRGDMGADPATMADLFDGSGKPAWDRFARTGWNGPYMESDGTPAPNYLSDEWGNSYDLSTAGEIKSLGPNGVDDSGAGDDIIITY